MATTKADQIRREVQSANRGVAPPLDLTEAFAALQEGYESAIPDPTGARAPETYRARLMSIVNWHHTSVVRKVPVSQPKSEREREALSAAKQIRKCSSKQEMERIIRHISDEVIDDFSDDRFKKNSVSFNPKEAADFIEKKVKSLRDSGLYGRKIRREDGAAYASNKGGRSRSSVLPMLIAGAIDIYKECTTKFPTLTNTKPGMRFLTAVVDAAGYQTEGLRHQVAYVLAIINPPKTGRNRPEDF